MRSTLRIALAVSLSLAVAACSSGGTGGPAIGSVNPASPSYSSLQFAVGTANLYNGTLGLNVVSTFRQTNGTSATGVNTPAITGPFTFTASAAPGGGADPYSSVLNGGPSMTEVAASTPAITGTPQTVAPGTPNCDASGAVPPGFVSCPAGLAPNTTTFGESGGVFAMGLAPYNHQGFTGQSWSYQPYAQPFYPSSAHVPFIPWGGPPAFDPDGTGLGERDGIAINAGTDTFGDPYFLGVGEGITVFDGVTPRTGAYTLTLSIVTVGNNGSKSTSTVNKSANLQSLALLPTITAPAVTPDASGDGGASFTMAPPAGVTEAYVQIVDYGPNGGPGESSPATNPPNCQGPRGTAFAPVYYTFHITSPASTTYRVPATIGPSLATTGGASNVQPSPTLCTAAQNTAANGGTATPGDDYVVQTIGFDYPAYAAAHSLIEQTTAQNPAITNGAGQADIALSVPMEQDAGGTPVPVRRAKRLFGGRL